MRYWAILSSVASLSDSALVSAAEVAPRDPPEVVVLTIPKRFFPENTTCVSVVAAGLSGVLLRAKETTSTGPSESYALLDHTCTSCVTLPNHGFNMPPGHLGLLDSPMGGDRYMLVELQPPTAMWEEAALVCFSSNKWERKVVDYPAKSRPFVPDGVIAHAERLHWVDLSCSIITCDPVENKPTLTSVDLPVVLKDRSGELEKRRCFGLSGNKLRFVDIYMDNKARPVENKNSMGKEYEKQIVMWSLERTDGFMNWTMDLVTPYEKIWNHKSYKNLGLPMELPVVAILDFIDPNVIYLYLEDKKFFFGIDMRTGEVMEGYPYQPPDRVFGGHFVLPWTLIPHGQTLHIDDINEGMSSPEYCSSNSDEPESPTQMTEEDQSNSDSESDEEGEWLFNQQ